MSDTILGGDFTVYYLGENRQKRIVWTGSATGTRSVNELYSGMADLLDELNQMDDGSALSAQTPTEYTIGIIDPSDKDPWFIDRTSVEHLYGGALKTNGWLRATGTNTGVLRIAYTASTADFVSGDIGKTVLHADGDTGTLLDYNTVSGTKYAWIRPATSAIGNNWDTGSGTFTVTGGTGSVSQASAPSSGESLWANIYSLGTLEANTHLYVYQNGVYLKKYKSTTSDWWPDGQFDILVNVKEFSTEIDEGFVTVFAREYTKSYDNYIVDLTAGGRNPIPLATGGDLNNDTGYRSLLTKAPVANTFEVGNYLYVGASWAAATKKARITAVSGTTPAFTITYALIGDLTDFANNDSLKEYTGLADGDGTATVDGAPANAGPATYNILITHAANDTFDITEDGNTEPYSIVIDLSNNGNTTPTYTMKQGYEFAKYVARRGGTATSFTDGIEGERYIGSDYRIVYVTLTGSVPEGSVITQYTGGFGVGFVATGTVVAHHTGDKILVLRNSRGTFNNTNTIYVDGSNHVATPSCTAVAPIKAAPFGTFAGGKFFAAPGVVFAYNFAVDANNFQLTDDGGLVRVAPTKVTVAVGNTRLGDKVAVFRTVGGIIQKDEYTADSGNAGATSVVVQEVITVDTPGKSTGGILRLVDVSALKEYRVRYASWATSTITLASSSGLTADSGTNTTTIVDAAIPGTTKVGDLIRNTTRSNAISYVTAFDGTSTITISPAIASQTTGDSYDINVLPVTVEQGVDTIYVPLIDSYETTGSDLTPGQESVSITYDTNIDVLVRARQAGEILPFETPSSVTNSGASVSVIRTPDTIFV
jgi:hypothetical protein